MVCSDVHPVLGRGGGRFSLPMIGQSQQFPRLLIVQNLQFPAKLSLWSWEVKRMFSKSGALLSKSQTICRVILKSDHKFTERGDCMFFSLILNGLSPQNLLLFDQLPCLPPPPQSPIQYQGGRLWGASAHCFLSLRTFVISVQKLGCYLIFVVTAMKFYLRLEKLLLFGRFFSSLWVQTVGPFGPSFVFRGFVEIFNANNQTNRASVSRGLEIKHLHICKYHNISNQEN